MRHAPNKSARAADRIPTRTDTKEASDDKAKDVAWEHLHVVIETDHLLDGGARCSLNEIDEAIIGRLDVPGVRRERRGGKNCLDVSVANVRTSERHARLSRDPGGWLLEDLGSRNGTFLNGNRIVERTVVRPGDLLQVGRAVFMLGRTTLAADAELGGDIDGESVESRSLRGFPSHLPRLADFLRRMRPAIESNDPIAIVGHTGTGKEVLANAIHAASRPTGPFVPVNCGGLAPNLIEGQLFGYLKGAYSGADRGDPGFVRAAHGGLLFLDEILELPLTAQAKLLRVLQQKEVVSLGSARSVKVDVRFIAATQRPLTEVVAAGLFRADLQARIERHVVNLPPLKERRADIGLLVAAILRKHGVRPEDEMVLSSAAMTRIFGYSWPLNIRELENALVRSLRFARGRVLDADSFPPPDQAAGPGEGQAPDMISNEDRECRNRVIAALMKHRGNVTEAAAELGAHREQLYRWTRRFGLDPKAFRSAQNSIGVVPH